MMKILSAFDIYFKDLFQNYVSPINLKEFECFEKNRLPKLNRRKKYAFD